LDGHTGSVNCAQFNFDGSRIVTASSDNTAQIWDAASGKPGIPFNGHTSFVYSAAFSQDGTRVITAGADRTVRIWDVGSGRLLSSFLNETIVDSSAFSPDGGLMVMADRDQTAKVFSVGIEIKTPPEVEEIVRRRVQWQLIGEQLVGIIP